jgi:hypothetical protein
LRRAGARLHVPIGPRQREAIMAVNLVNLKLIRPGGRPAVIHSGRRR